MPCFQTMLIIKITKGFLIAFFSATKRELKVEIVKQIELLAVVKQPLESTRDHVSNLVAARLVEQFRAQQAFDVSINRIDHLFGVRDFLDVVGFVCCGNDRIADDVERVTRAHCGYSSNI